MNLLSFCEKQGGTGLRSCPVLARLAADIPCSAETLYMIAKGHKKPGPRMCASIEERTQKAVTRHDLRPEYFAEPATKRKRAA